MPKMPEKKLTRDQWAATVADVIAEHPEWMAATVNAVQAGILEAQERQLGRIADVSMGLVEALNTKPGHVKRNHAAIVRAVEASNVHGSKWAEAMISKESA
jgi:hypothetical protein